MSTHNRSRLITAVVLLGAIAFCALFAVPEPDSVMMRLTPVALLTNGLPVAYVFLAFRLILNRRLTAALLTLFVCVAITLGSNFKYSVVSQPVVASDFIVFGQVLENPVLFEKYLREQWLLLPALLLGLALPLWVIRLEQPLVADKRWVVALLVAGALMFWQIQAILLKPQAPLQHLYVSLLPPFDHQDPMTAVAQHGLLATLIMSAGDSYFRLPPVDATDEAIIEESSRAVVTQAADEAPRPHVVIIQNEAFFDFRVLNAAFPASAYAQWDRLKPIARHGMATVDTYGGATLRTEFSLLTGVPAYLFGAAMDYPYLTVVTAPMNSVPRHLKSLGYETTAIHPFHRSFWRRDRAYPWLGFDSFLSLDAFRNAEYDGPYVSDRAVCDQIRRLLNEADAPRFIFAVTMENHGPWSFERGQSGRLDQFDTAIFGLPEHLDLQLKRYLYHAQNAAAMTGCVIDGLKNSGRPGVLLVLGDHAPAMPTVFAAFGVDNPWQEPALRTVPYLLWHSGNADAADADADADAADTTVSELPAMLLDVAGLPLDDFLRDSRHLRRRCEQPQGGGAGPGFAEVCPDSPETALLALTERRLRPISPNASIKK